MITDPDRFRQDKSPYERPNFPYRCGRISIWGKPCGSGPNSNGTCGGTSECTPFFDNGRWACRRSVQSGGPCESGPLPDGQCCNQHPPCKPVPTLRGYRGRLSLLAAALVLALIGAFSWNGDGAKAISSISPGALTDGHAQFTREKGCATCHAPHGEDATAWVKAAWSPNSLSDSCQSCHTFSGPAMAAHNEEFPDQKDAEPTQCVMCHTEHKGPDAHIVKLADAQCSACHKQKFESFSDGHPSFSKTYPSRRRTAIAFDHTSHLTKHFEDQRFADRAPKERCISCHDTSRALRNVPVRAYEETCAACHAEQIPDRDMVVFTIPEFEENPFDAAAVGEFCGPSGESLESAGEILESARETLSDVEEDSSATEIAKDLGAKLGALQSRLGLGDGEGAESESDEEYESVSSETLPPVSVLLLGIEDGEDVEAYTEPVRDFVMGMIESGVEAFSAGLEDHPEAQQLFAGLSPDLLRRAGCAWASNLEYEAPSDAKAGGWFADEYSIRYKPLQHADPVARAWIRLAAKGGETVSEDLQEAMLSRSDGPGACTKCHSVNAGAGESNSLDIAWKFGAQSNQRHLQYSHAPHLNLLGLGLACETCHKLDQTADYAAAFKQYDPSVFASNFNSIEKATCVECHADGKVRQECTLCHEYHNGHGFKRRMTTAILGKSGN